MSQSRQLAAIMFTDIVGYTALMDEDEQRAFELLKKNRQVQRPLIEKYNGKWLKEMGDGVLASFSTVTDAVFCAAAIQKTCEDEPDLNLRIGIHQGEVVFDGEDVFGSGVNIASRLEPLAPVGGILVSESVHNNLINKKDVESTYIGEKQLKNVKKPVKVYQVHVEGVDRMVTVEPSTVKQQASPTPRNPKRIGLISLTVIVALVVVYFFYPRKSPDKTQIVQPEVIDKSIAVLPFKNDSPDTDNQYFADGMMDEILNHLQKIAELGVKSRTAVEPYRNSTLSFGAIAQELDVAFVLEGAVRKYGDRFRVTTQLIDVESGNHLWSETYDGIFSDTIFVIQSNIAKQIASALDVVITPEQEKVIDKFPTTSVAAYELLIRGSQEMTSYWRTGDKKFIPKARKFFNGALMIDPEYYYAIASKGNAFMAEGNYDSAFVYIEKLLVLDPKSSEAYQLKGECYYFMGKLDLAIGSYTSAINMSSFNSTHSKFWTHIQLGRTLVEKDDLITALSYYSKAFQLDYQRKLGAYIFLAIAFTSVGDYDMAAKYLQTITGESIDNCFHIMLYARGLFDQGKFQQLVQFINSKCDYQACERACNQIMFRTSLMQGKFEEAEQYFSQWQGSNSMERGGLLNNYYYEIGYGYFQLGKTSEADKVFLEEIQKLELDLDGNDTNFHLSRIYAFKGDKVKALKYLSEYAKSEHLGMGWHDFALIDPFFESLREDTEFKEIIRQQQEKKTTLRAQIWDMEERGELAFPL